MLVDLSRDEIVFLLECGELWQSTYRSPTPYEFKQLHESLIKFSSHCPYGCKTLETRCKECGRLACSASIEPQWISVKDRLPVLIEQTVLALCKVGMEYCQKKDNERPIQMFVGHIYNELSHDKRRTPEYRFEVECECSGYEHDREYLYPIYWMTLPTPPKV